MTWKDEIRKEEEPEYRALIGITKELLERIQDELYSLSVEQLDKLYDALEDAFNLID